MNEFQLALLALKGLAAATEAVASAKQVYDTFKQQALRTGALTKEQSDALDAKELEIENSAANQPSGR